MTLILLEKLLPIVEYHTPSCRLEVLVERGVTPPPQPPNQLADSWYPDHLPNARLKGPLCPEVWSGVGA